MNKTIATALCAATFLMTTGCSTIVSSMMPDPMTDETANKVLAENQNYLPDHSFAYNLCRYTANSKGDFSCSKDIEMPKAEYDKMFGANAKRPVDGSYAASIGLYALSGAIQPGFFDSFSGFGPGALFLIGGLLTGNPGDKAKDRFIAFVPVSKAKTKEEAIDYAYESLANAYRKTFKKYSFKELAYQKKYSTAKIGEHITTGKVMAVSNGNDCKMIDTEDGKTDFQCFFFTYHANDFIVGEETTIPLWLPNGGQKAWVVVGKAQFKTSKSYTGTLNQRDMAVDEAKGLPDNFYLLVPEATKDGKELPPFVVSNKSIYFYAVPKN